LSIEFVAQLVQTWSLREGMKKRNSFLWHLCSKLILCASFGGCGVPSSFLKSFQEEAKSGEEHKRLWKEDGRTSDKVQSIMRELFSEQ